MSLDAFEGKYIRFKKASAFSKKCNIGVRNGGREQPPSQNGRVI